MKSESEWAFERAEDDEWGGIRKCRLQQGLICLIWSPLRKWASIPRASEPFVRRNAPWGRNRINGRLFAATRAKSLSGI